MDELERRRVSDRRAAAIVASRRGWSVVPLHTPRQGACSCGVEQCPSPGKHTRVAWRRYMDRPADVQQIQRWWRTSPDANLGVVTGAVSDLVVLDVDPRNDGDNSLAVLEGRHGALPPTVESRTGGGGRHLYFHHPGIPVPSRPVAQGIDVKGDGGLVVCPPSVHASGGRYVWAEGRAPMEVPLAQLPTWLEVAVGEPALLRARSHFAEHMRPVRTTAERAQFADLWASVGIRVGPGDEIYLCPFHADHHASLHIDADGCRFYCFGCGRGGGSGRLRRLIGSPRAIAPREDGRHEAHDLEPTPLTPPRGTDDVHVVGESAYQDALFELAGGRRHFGGVRIRVVARLVPEPDNPVDPEAIAVRIGGRTVGHLAREDARRCRAAVLAEIERTGEATCAAEIVGGWDRGRGDVGMFGVRLRFVEPDRHTSRVRPGR